MGIWEYGNIGIWEHLEEYEGEKGVVTKEDGMVSKWCNVYAEIGTKPRITATTTRQKTVHGKFIGILYVPL
jgi:hypothetical protein